MNPRGPHSKPLKPTSYAGPTTCLRCDTGFESWDRRQNRLCPSCQDAIKEQPSDESSYPLPTPRRRFQAADDV
jgi:hypothetical protein